MLGARGDARMLLGAGEMRAFTELINGYAMVRVRVILIVYNE